MLDARGRPATKAQRRGPPGRNNRIRTGESLVPPPGKSAAFDSTRTPEEVAITRAALRDAIPVAVSTLIEILEDQHARDGDRLLAARIVLEYTVPRPRDTEADTEQMRSLVELLRGEETVVSEVVSEAEIVDDQSEP